MSTLRYEVLEMDLCTHEFSLRLSVAQPRPVGQRLTLPAWIPGSYMVRDFARNIIAISARDARGPVALFKLDKQTWEAAACDGELVVEYQVYAFDLSVRSAYLDRTRAYFNGTSLFLSLPDCPDAAWRLRIGRPGDPAATRWRVATTLPAADVDEQGFGWYAGQGYDLLIDCPVEIGTFEHAQFAVGGTPHELILSDGGRFDMQRACRDVSNICAEHAAMFGELPVGRYQFQALATADGYGGLEHRDSTSLMCRRSDLPRLGLGRPDKGYRQFLALCSHEYFHLWNVKRIRPARLAEADLSREAHTELLWAFEGITSYYDELALVRSGVLSSEEYLDLFAATVTRVLRAPGRLRQSIAESSFDAWTKFYKQDENAPNAIVSYYTKGALVAFGLDLALRKHSAGRVTLDHLMRRLWQRYGRTGKGIPERGIEREVAQLAGASFDDFFQQFVYGTCELPLAEWFAMLGIGFRARPAGNADDLGGCQPAPPKDRPPPGLGARFEVQPAGLRLTQVYAGGAALAAGLAPNDWLVAVDSERVSATNLSDLLGRADGEELQVHYFRRDRLAVATLPVRAAADDTCDLWLLPDAEAGDGALAMRRAWLKSNRGEAA